MKAIVQHKYGSPDVLNLEEVQKPTPNDNQLWIKVQAASINALDWHLMRADPFPVRLMTGLLKPKEKILGADIAGWVEAVGKNVQQFQPGDAVFGESGRGGFADSWRLWRRGDVCRTNCQIVWGRGNGRLQHQKFGNGTLNWGGSSH